MKNNGELTTKILIGLLCVIYVLSRFILDPQTANNLINQFTFLGIAVKEGEVWRLITGGLLHGSEIHLLCNCYCLWQFLPWVTSSFGWQKTHLVLWLGVIGGAVLSGIWDPLQPGLGISGGIFALFGVYILALRALQKHNNNPNVSSALNSAYMMLAVNLYLGWQIEIISNAGHIGGLIVGVVLGLIFMRPQIQRVGN